MKFVSRAKTFRAGMDPFGDDHIAWLLRLKRYEQPPPGYLENFLHEFRRRQRDELVRQPLWRICFERAEAFALLIGIFAPKKGNLSYLAMIQRCAIVI